VTLSLTLDRVILHTIVHYSSTSAHMPNFIEIEETFCGRYTRTYGRTDWHTLRPALLGRLCRRVDLRSFIYFLASVSELPGRTVKHIISIFSLKYCIIGLPYFSQSLLHFVKVVGNNWHIPTLMYVCLNIVTRGISAVVCLGHYSSEERNWECSATAVVLCCAPRK